MSNAWQRILTALVGAPLLIGLAYLGGVYFAVLVLALAMAGQAEVYALMARGGMRALQAAGLLLGALVVLSPLFVWMLPLAAGLGVGVLAATPFLQDRDPFQTLGGTFFGVLYPSGLLAFFLLLRLGIGLGVTDEQAFYLTLSVFLFIWATDTFAYVAGKSLGRHKLAPAVSPKKTWEGSAGGAVGAVAVGLGLKLTVLAFLPWIDVVAMALLCGIFSQLGDLAESRLKRAVEAKDSGTLLPGHGGILDRFDALIVAVPLVYLYLAFVAPLWR